MRLGVEFSRAGGDVELSVDRSAANDPADPKKAIDHLCPSRHHQTSALKRKFNGHGVEHRRVLREGRGSADGQKEGGKQEGSNRLVECDERVGGFRQRLVQAFFGEEAGDDFHEITVGKRLRQKRLYARGLKGLAIPVEVS